MSSDGPAEGVTRGTTTREGPAGNCFWKIEVTGEDQYARDDAKKALEAHFKQKHCSVAKVQIVLEKESVLVEPGEELSDVLDRFHDRMAEDPPGSWEVAYACGEYTADDPADVGFEEVPY